VYSLHEYSYESMTVSIAYMSIAMSL